MMSRTRMLAIGTVALLVVSAVAFGAAAWLGTRPDGAATADSGPNPSSSATADSGASPSSSMGAAERVAAAWAEAESAMKAAPALVEPKLGPGWKVRLAGVIDARPGRVTLMVSLHRPQGSPGQSTVMREVLVRKGGSWREESWDRKFADGVPASAPSWAGEGGDTALGVVDYCVRKAQGIRRLTPEEAAQLDKLVTGKLKTRVLNGTLKAEDGLMAGRPLTVAKLSTAMVSVSPILAPNRARVLAVAEEKSPGSGLRGRQGVFDVRMVTEDGLWRVSEIRWLP